MNDQDDFNLERMNERLMIGKLKQECGHAYTAKLEGMLLDVQTSGELSRAFAAHQQKMNMNNNLQPQQNANVPELKLNILTSGFWPTSPNPISSIELPKQMKMMIDNFEEFYNSRHQGRRLTWNYGQGQADLRARFNKRHELVVSCVQACILFLIGDKEYSQYQQGKLQGNTNIGNVTVSFNEIVDGLKIPLDELKRHLQSLYASPKCKILVKVSPASAKSDKTEKTEKSTNDTSKTGEKTEKSEKSSSSSDSKKEPQDGDFFHINPNFESKQVRVKVPLIRKEALVAHQNQQMMNQLLQSGYGNIQMGAAGPGESGDNRNINSTNLQNLINNYNMISSDQQTTALNMMNIEEDRKHLIESVIVRIMKSRKRLTHNELIVEVTKHLQNRFTPSPVGIKDRIEKLIEREFLERDSNDRKVYCYLA